MPAVCVLISQGYTALVDADDYPRVREHRWHASRIHRTVYASSVIKNKNTYLHRFILDVTDQHAEIDHRDGDGLNNTRCNLRLARHSQNLANQRLSVANTSGYKGVVWLKVGRKWRAQTKHRGKFIDIGQFSTAVEAAHAYDAFMSNLHGDFAALNFPLTACSTA